MKSVLLSVIFISCFILGACHILPSIPPQLLPCYANGAPDLVAPRRLDVFLSLLKKIELNSQLDMRMLSTALLRSLRLDGIEQSYATAVQTDFILPFRASGFQFHKYKLLMDIFLPSQDLIEVDEIFTLAEKCLMHRMLSSTVRQWERGDENIVCPVSAQHLLNMITQSNTSINSRCPIEEGVVQTNWGTIAPGTLVSAIASSLEYQRVIVTDILSANIFKEEVAEQLIDSAMQDWYDDIETLSEQTKKQNMESVDIGNVWVATLAGDLAEVVVNQGPRVGSVSQRMVIGSNNRWNDTLLPRNYYIFPQNSSVVDWHFTDSEILAGLDGLILAHYVPKWVERRRTLRLSHIIDMYYSNEGVSFDSTVKACNRQNLLNNILNSSDLFTEASRFAHVLSLRQITVYIPIEEMERITEAAIRAFTTYLPTLLRQNHRECSVGRSIPVMDLVIATDGSWKGYDVEEFISWIGGELELNLLRTTISLLHGNTGGWIAPPSNNLTALFSHIHNFTDEWPNRLNLPNVVSSVIQHSLKKSLADISNRASAGPSTVVLIISPSDRPSETELERARTLMSTLRSSYFDVYFAYVTQDLGDFQNINNEYLDYSELFITCTSTAVSDVITSVDTYLIKSNIPTRIMGAQCPFNGSAFDHIEYEDFVLPDRQTFYRIHPFYLRQQSLTQVQMDGTLEKDIGNFLFQEHTLPRQYAHMHFFFSQFRNEGQGQLLACMWRGADTSHNCQTLSERGIHTFNMTTPCASPEFCLPAHFVITAISTQNLCAHNDCRLPNQVSYYIHHSGLRCLPLKGSATAFNIAERNVLVFVVILFYLI